MIEHQLECPNCHHKFTLQDDYLNGDCEACQKAHYYWDHVYDEEEGETYFEGYHWDITSDEDWREGQLKRIGI